MEKPDERLDKIMADNHLGGTVFDAYRIVNVDDNTISNMRDNRIVTGEVQCFDIWGHGAPCENCISRRAQNERRQVVKLECTDEKAFLVIAVPVVVDEQDTVIELIKDMSESLVSYGASRMHHHRMMDLIERMNVLAVTDSFTKLYNKTYIKEQLLRDVKNPEELVAVMVDIDNFKEINDSYGHSVGDQVILHIADQIRACIGTDACWAARYGGEEFLIVCRGKCVDEVIESCYRLKNQISEAFVPSIGDDVIRVTASFGIHAFEDGVDDVDSLVRRADENLYLSKRKGKNAITCG